MKENIRKLLRSYNQLSDPAFDTRKDQHFKELLELEAKPTSGNTYQSNLERQLEMDALQFKINRLETMWGLALGGALWDHTVSSSKLRFRRGRERRDRLVQSGKLKVQRNQRAIIIKGMALWRTASLSTRTAQAAFNQVYKSLRLLEGITFHSLQHSYATHLVENGIDVTFVQHLLGHNDVQTTLRYTHVSQKKINNIESPPDRALRLKNENENEK